MSGPRPPPRGPPRGKSNGRRASLAALKKAGSMRPGAMGTPPRGPPPRGAPGGKRMSVADAAGMLSMMQKAMGARPGGPPPKGPPRGPPRGPPKTRASLAKISSMAGMAGAGKPPPPKGPPKRKSTKKKKKSKLLEESKDGEEKAAPIAPKGPPPRPLPSGRARPSGPPTARGTQRARPDGEPSARTGRSRPAPTSSRDKAMSSAEFGEKLKALMEGGSDTDSGASSTDSEVEVGGDMPPPPPDKPPPFKLEMDDDMGKPEPRPGRVKLTLKAATAVGVKGGTAVTEKQPVKVPESDKYVKFMLGSAKEVPSPIIVSTSVRKGVGHEFSFDDEKVVFNVPDPIMIVSHPRAPTMLRWWVYQKEKKGKDTMLGTGELDFTNVYKCVGGKDRTIRFDLHEMPRKVKGADGTMVAAVPMSMGEMTATVDFYTAIPGVLVVAPIEGQDLPNMELVGKQDPYVEIELGKEKRRTETIKEGGENPQFGSEEMDMPLPPGAWTQKMSVNVWDEDIAKRDFIGGVDLDVVEYLQTYDKVDRTIQLFKKDKKKQAGTLKTTFQFFPAGMLTVKMVEARNLASMDSVGRQDPYAKVYIEGDHRTQHGKTKVERSAGARPVWNEQFTFDVVSATSMKVEVYDHDRLTEDDLIGTVTLPLSTVYREGIKDGWVPIKARGTWGRMEDRGEVHLQVDFVGPEGIKYPQRKPEYEAFDHRERQYRPGKGPLRATRHKSVVQVGEQAVTMDDFTDADIEFAFKFIDLDHNLHVGPAEIRHILTCMGELITDEEIDMMINMVDLNRNGMVEFDEFYALCKHPDPASDDFQIALQNSEAFQVGAKKKKGPPRPGTVGARVGVGATPGTARSGKPVMAALRAMEVQQREEKRHSLTEFVKENAIRLNELKKCFKRYEKLDGSEDGLVAFEEMCTVFDVEASSSNRELYNIFVDAAKGRADVREIMLGLNNFTGADRNQRVNFCFFLYDSDNTGYLEKDELVKILKANHLASDLSSIKKKAETVLKQADKDGNGRVDLQEFVILAQKFPALIFPNFSTAAADVGAATARMMLQMSGRSGGPGAPPGPPAGFIPRGGPPRANLQPKKPIRQQLSGRDAFYSMAQPSARGTGRQAQSMATAMAKNRMRAQKGALASARGTQRGTARGTARR